MATRTKDMDPTDTIQAPRSRRRVTFLRSRGRTGKTTIARYLIEKRRQQGWAIIVADADKLNPSLSGFFPEAMVPESEDPGDVSDMIQRALNTTAGRDDASLIVDLPGGDQGLASFGRELNILRFCERQGLEAEVIYSLGPVRDDLIHIENIEKDGSFLAPRALLACNAGLVEKGVNPVNAFRPILAMPEWARLTDPKGRAARRVVIPKLHPLGAINDLGLSLLGAAAGERGKGDAALDLVAQHQTDDWLHDMAEMELA